MPQPPHRNHTPSRVAAKTLHSILFPIASDPFPIIHLEGHSDDSVPVWSSVASEEWKTSDNSQVSSASFFLFSPAIPKIDVSFYVVQVVQTKKTIKAQTKIYTTQLGRIVDLYRS